MVSFIIHETSLSLSFCVSLFSKQKHTTHPSWPPPATIHSMSPPTTNHRIDQPWHTRERFHTQQQHGINTQQPTTTKHQINQPTPISQSHPNQLTPTTIKPLKAAETHPQPRSNSTTQI